MSYERDKISYLIGKRIKDLRQSKKMSQEQLALSSGLHPAYLGRVERGEKCASIETLSKVSKGLDVPLSEVIDIDAPISDSKKQALNRIEYLFSGVNDKTASEIAEIVEKIVNLNDTDTEEDE